MDESVHAADQLPRGHGVTELTWQPLDRLGHSLEAATVALGSKPTTKPIAGVGELPHDVAPQEAGRSGNRDLHGGNTLSVKSRGHRQQEPIEDRLAGVA